MDNTNSIPTRNPLKDVNFDGEWVNSSIGTKGISGFEYFQKDGKPFIRLSWSSSSRFPGLEEEVLLRTHAADPSGLTAVAFMAESRPSNASAMLAGNINQGLIIIAAYIHFGTENGMQPYFIREFFHKKKQS